MPEKTNANNLFEVNIVDIRKNLKEEYLRQSIMTASPGELTVMLFNGCIKDLRLAEVAMEEPADLLKVNEYLIKAQKILSELMSSLDLSYELSGQLLPIYSYLLREIRHMNVKKDFSKMPEILNILSSQRDTWEQVTKVGSAGEDWRTASEQ